VPNNSYKLNMLTSIAASPKNLTFAERTISLQLFICTSCTAER